MMIRLIPRFIVSSGLFIMLVLVKLVTSYDCVRKPGLMSKSFTDCNSLLSVITFKGGRSL